ncbi:MAG: hypothetical protein AB9836_11390 [Aminipila sp.]
MKRNWICLILLLSVALFTACGNQKEEAIDKYCTDIESLEVEDDFTEGGEELNTILSEIQTQSQQQQTIDWVDIEKRTNDCLEKLRDKKAEVEKIEISDEQVKETNTYLVATYDSMINGYQKLIKAYETGDSALLQEGAKSLEDSQNSITKWQELLNKE